MVFTTDPRTILKCGSALTAHTKPHESGTNFKPRNRHCAQQRGLHCSQNTPQPIWFACRPPSTTPMARRQCGAIRGPSRSMKNYAKKWEISRSINFGARLPASNHPAGSHAVLSKLRETIHRISPRFICRIWIMQRSDQGPIASRPIRPAVSSMPKSEN